MNHCMGYYVTSMRKRLVVPYGYRPDRFDKDLFLSYNVQLD